LAELIADISQKYPVVAGRIAEDNEWRLADIDPEATFIVTPFSNLNLHLENEKIKHCFIAPMQQLSPDNCEFFATFKGPVHVNWDIDQTLLITENDKQNINHRLVKQFLNAIKNTSIVSLSHSVLTNRSNPQFICKQVCNLIKMEVTQKAVSE